MQPREQRTVINNVDVTGLCEQGLVYHFDQRQALVHRYFSDGLCLGFTASLMRQLLNENVTAIQYYSNPLPQPILCDAVVLTHAMIDRVRDGSDLNAVMFDGRKVEKIHVKPEHVPQVLADVGIQNGATLTYKTSNGGYHMLLFFNKQNGRCVIQDANRFTADNVDSQSGIKVLKEIIDRSHPETVEISHTVSSLKAKL